ncbi:MAG: hypothetical protein COV76_05125 [Candidatus Omnitrophica bacterium CG11_big_fil_rev_8_21_14_0_20_64_10]|nr:MAG: hypothetical protein COV76_05125 [Candidatus Omnitrophica bacterium CG11_big_fil_rev_8_21_14_0_20_64_10]
MEFFKEPLEFEWDAGNREKNFLKHRVSTTECEEVFFDPHKRMIREVLFPAGGRRERRHVLIGRTSEKRVLYVVFTMRTGRIRVISARDLSRRERGLSA